MRISFLPCLLLAIIPVEAVAQNCDEASTVAQHSDFFRGDRGVFAFSAQMLSSVHPQRCQSVHIVCNLDPIRDLVFGWPSPNFGVGNGGRLESGTCGGISRELTGFEEDLRAYIEFTPRRDRVGAPSYISRIESPWLPGFSETIFRRFRGAEASPEAMQSVEPIFELSQSYTTSDDGIEFRLSWTTRSTEIILSPEAFGLLSIEELAGQLSESGFSVRVGPLENILVNNVPAAFDGLRGEFFIRISEPNGLPGDIALFIPADNYILGTAPMLIISAEGDDTLSYASIPVPRLANEE